MVTPLLLVTVPSEAASFPCVCNRLALVGLGEEVGFVKGNHQVGRQRKSQHRQPGRFNPLLPRSQLCAGSQEAEFVIGRPDEGETELSFPCRVVRRTATANARTVMIVLLLGSRVLA